MRKQQPSVDLDEFQLAQYKKRSAYGIRTDVKPMSEPRIASFFTHHVAKEIQENDIRHLLDCANIKVLDICALLHELAKHISFKIVSCHQDVDIVPSFFLWPARVGCRRFYSKRLLDSTNIAVRLFSLILYMLVNMR